MGAYVPVFIAVAFGWFSSARDRFMEWGERAATGYAQSVGVIHAVTINTDRYIVAYIFRGRNSHSKQMHQQLQQLQSSKLLDA